MTAVFAMTLKKKSDGEFEAVIHRTTAEGSGPMFAPEPCSTLDEVEEWLEEKGFIRTQAYKPDSTGACRVDLSRPRS